LIRDRTHCREMIYVGDTVDDARCSRAASVPFIGIAAPSNPLNAELAALLGAEGAVAVLDDVNQIEGALAQCAAPRSNE
jgi:phosphoglycolate phosphatase-like HAD superfamily hydrolase